MICGVRFSYTVVAAAACIMLFGLSCEHFRRIDPSPAARSAIVRRSGGPAPVSLAVLEVYSNGCARYRRGRVDRRVCGRSVQEAIDGGPLSSGAFQDALETLRLVPRTMADADALRVLHDGKSATVYIQDVSQRARFATWLADVDTLLSPAFGNDYLPLTASTYWGTDDK